MQAESVEVYNELTDLAEEVDRLAVALERRPDLTGLDGQDRWERSHFLGSATEKVYTGCENVMARIASGIDKAAVPHGDGWHMTLLRRMSHPFPGVRRAVIDGDTFVKLDRLRAFRHRERNCYAPAPSVRLPAHGMT